MAKKLLITGALGHIGSKVIHGIKPGEYDEVVLLDDFSTQRYASLFNLPEDVRFTFIEENIDKADWDSRLKGIDAVFHFAAITDAASSFGKEEQVERVNFEGTKRLAEACARNGVRLIFPSTTSVYGVQGNLVDENCSINDLKPQSPYAASKLKAEQYLQKLGETSQLKFVILRLGTIFGISVGMRFHTAVNKFSWQAVMGQPVSVWRTALHQKRPYLDLNDAVDAFKFIVQKDLFDGRVYNVVTANATVNDILDVIRTDVPDLTIQYVDTAIMNQLSYEVSSERFCKTGFKFRGALKQGIGETIKLIRGARYVHAGRV